MEAAVSGGCSVGGCRRLQCQACKAANLSTSSFNRACSRVNRSSLLHRIINRLTEELRVVASRPNLLARSARDSSLISCVAHAAIPHTLPRAICLAMKKSMKVSAWLCVTIMPLTVTNTLSAAIADAGIIIPINKATTYFLIFCILAFFLNNVYHKDVNFSCVTARAVDPFGQPLRPIGVQLPGVRPSWA